VADGGYYKAQVAIFKRNFGSRSWSVNEMAGEAGCRMERVISDVQVSLRHWSACRLPFFLFPAHVDSMSMAA
jgi:hypothetical protein